MNKSQYILETAEYQQYSLSRRSHSDNKLKVKILPYELFVPSPKDVEVGPNFPLGLTKTNQNSLPSLTQANHF